jgi:hypothetical protein
VDHWLSPKQGLLLASEAKYFHLNKLKMCERINELNHNKHAGDFSKNFSSENVSRLVFMC